MNSSSGGLSSGTERSALSSDGIGIEVCMTRFIRRVALAFVVVMIPIAAAASTAQDEEVVKPGPGVTLPRPIHEEKPQYTKEALAAGIQGTVLLSAVVDKDGTVGRVEVIRSLDKMYG